MFATVEAAVLLSRARWTRAVERSYLILKHELFCSRNETEGFDICLR